MKKISDLKIGQEYYFCFIKSVRLAFKAKVLDFVNVPGNNTTEIYIEVDRGRYNRRRVTSYHLVYASEVGFGETKRQAVINKGKFNFEENVSFKKNLLEVETALNQINNG